MEAIQIKEIVKAVDGTLLCGDQNAFVTSVTTNSKEVKEGALFVPIIGERVDGHNYIKGAFEQGAQATFTSCETDIVDSTKAYIKVKDTQKALQQLAVYYRSLFSIPVVGITGSVGKTTTKEMIASALETKLSVLKTAGNMNSQIGLPLTVFGIEKKHDVAILEMGMSEEGEMKELAKIARPTMAVMTNIGVSHIGQLGSKENIRKEKLNIINGMEGTAKEIGKTGMLFINSDDMLLREIIPSQSYLQQPENGGTCVDLTKETKQSLTSIQIHSFGTDEKAKYCGSQIEVKENHTFFSFSNPDGEESIELSVLGTHNVNNAVVALAIAKEFGISPAVAKEGLKSYQPIAMRGQIFEKDGVRIIDDTYNASPDSMKSGINVLLSIEGAKRRIAVLADVLELGEKSYACHYSVGEYIVEVNKRAENNTNNIAMVVLVGTEIKAIKDAIEKAALPIEVLYFETNKEAIDYLKASLKSQDAVLIKGSRGMHMDEIVKALVTSSNE